MLKNLAVSLFLIAVAPLALAQTGTFKTAQALRADASEQSAAAGNVAEGARFDVVERKGFWVRVKAGAATGWAKLSTVNLESGSAGAGSAGSVLSGLASGRAGSGNIVSTAGTRGLSAEELKASKPDMEAVAQLKRQAAPAPAAASYAQSGGLRSRQLEYLPAPEPKQ